MVWYTEYLEQKTENNACFSIYLIISFELKIDFEQNQTPKI